jgi:hypothetical protein
MSDPQISTELENASAVVVEPLNVPLFPIVEKSTNQQETAQEQDQKQEKEQKEEQKQQIDEYPARIHTCPIEQGCICDTSPSSSSMTYEKRYRLRCEFQWKKIAPQAMTICLEEEKDRLVTSSKQFHENGLCRMTSYFRTQRPSKKEISDGQVQQVGIYAIWRAHQELAKYVKSQRLASVIVFESDILFVSPSMGSCRLLPQEIDTVAKNCTIDLELTPWDIFFLGHAPSYGYPHKSDLSVWRTWSHMTHAFVLTTQGISRLAGFDFFAAKRLRNGEEQDIDKWILQHMTQYCCSPQIAAQSGATSNNRNSATGSFDWTKVYEATITLHRVALQYIGRGLDWFLYALPIIWILLTLLAIDLLGRFVSLILPNHSNSNTVSIVS